MREARYGEAEPSPHIGRQSHISVAHVGCGKLRCVLGVSASSAFFFGLIRHTQQIRELSVVNGAKENAEDAKTPRTHRVGVSLGSLIKFLISEFLHQETLRTDLPPLQLQVFPSLLEI